MSTRSRFVGTFLFGFIFISLLSACSGQSTQDDVEIMVTDPPSEPTQLAEVQSTTSEGQAPEAEATATTEGAFEPPPPGFSLGDPNLHATDPQTVSLASGEIQLLEFFAFW